MLKRLVTYAGLFALVAMLNINCSKDDDEPPTAKTKTELITKATWKFEKAIATPGGDISNNDLLKCYIDNTITFTSDLKGTIVDGGVQCSTAAPSPFSWSFQNSETVLHLSFTLFSGGSPDFTIVSLTETNLVLSQQMTFPGFPPTTVEITFKH